MGVEDHDERLRDLEKATAVSAETMRSIQVTLNDFKVQIQAFLDKAQLALAIEGRVQRLEEETAELFKKADAAFKLIDAHKTDYASLKAEHGVCMNSRTTGNSWWMDRFGKVVDAGLIGVVVWLLTIYKTH